MSDILENGNSSIAINYNSSNEERVLRQVLLLKNWFEICTTKQIGDPDLDILVLKLMKEEGVSYTNKDIFFTQYHARELKPNVTINKSEQDNFNKKAEWYLKKYDLSWEYYLTYKKNS